MPTRDSSSRMWLGIAFVEAEIAILACQDAIVKLLSESFPIWQVVLVRSVISSALLLAVVSGMGGFGALKTHHFLENLMRATLFFLSHLCYYLAIASLPLATAVAINAAAPLFVVALSPLLLGERVGPHRWVAVITGFVGVLMMVRPFSGPIELGAIFALAGAFTYALVIIATRRLTHYEESSRIALYTMLFFGVYAAVGGGIVAFLDLPVGDHAATQYLLRHWSLPSIPAGLLMGLIGLLAAVGHVLFALAYQNAPASLLAPFEYSALIFAGVLGYVFWGDIPDTQTVLGILIVVFTGLYVAHRENKG